MPQRILREYAAKIKPKTIEQIEARIQEIENYQKSFNPVKSGDMIQVVKFSLSCEKRRLYIKLSKLKGFTHTFNDELRLIKSVGGKCANCNSTSNPSIDHIIPLSKGGHNGVENLQVLCSRCNCKKGNRI